MKIKLSKDVFFKGYIPNFYLTELGKKVIKDKKVNLLD